MAYICSHCDGTGKEQRTLADNAGVILLTCPVCHGWTQSRTSDGVTGRRSLRSLLSRRLLWWSSTIAFLVVVGGAAIWVYGNRQTPNSTPQIEPKGKEVTFTLKDKDGSLSVIPLKKNLVVVRMATWCPYATEFRDKLNRHRNDSSLAGLRFVYVFDDEWIAVRSLLSCEGKASAAEVDRQIAARREMVGNSQVIDPQFLTISNAEIYYSHPNHLLPGNGYPLVIAADGGIQSEHALAWLGRRLKK